MMNKNEQYIKLIDEALSKAMVLSNENTNFQPLESTKLQLQYVKSILDGSIIDRSRLEEIILGVYAAREFEDRDMEFANYLYDVELVVDQLKSGEL